MFCLFISWQWDFCEQSLYGSWKYISSLCKELLVFTVISLNFSEVTAFWTSLLSGHYLSWLAASHLLCFGSFWSWVELGALTFLVMCHSLGGHFPDFTYHVSCWIPLKVSEIFYLNVSAWSSYAVFDVCFMWGHNWPSLPILCVIQEFLVYSPTPSLMLHSVQTIIISELGNRFQCISAHQQLSLMNIFSPLTHSQSLNCTVPSSYTWTICSCPYNRTAFAESRLCQYL